MEKLHASKTLLKMAVGRMHIPHPTPLDSPLVMSYRNHQKNQAYLSHLASLVLFLFTKRQSQTGKGGRVWHYGLAPKYAPEGRVWTMEGPRLFHRTDWKTKKGLCLLRCHVFPENFAIVKSKIKVRTSSDVLFSTESIGEERKKGHYRS